MRNPSDLTQGQQDLLSSTSRRKAEKDLQIQLKDFTRGKQTNRVSLLSTVLGCISLLSHQRRGSSNLISRTSLSYNNQQPVFSWNFTDEYQITIDQDVVKENLQHFTSAVPTINMHFVSYCMSVFESFMDQDCVNFLQNSTNPNKNIQKIFKNSNQPDGGSSGQFFFFTHDNRILLKTITKNEQTVFLQRLQAYYHHIKNHPESLIVKIYGVFTVINLQTNDELNFMMMGNLFQNINKKYVLRIYDCKGSSHKREVFKQSKQEQQHNYSKKTMKDIDFDRIQNKVWLKEQDSRRVREALIDDSAFLMENGLIDYSLIIVKLDYNAYCLDLEEEKPTFNNRTMFYNQKQPNMVYVLGVIDYLQTWNARKKGERWYKSLFTNKNTISSQSPGFYCKRFNENIIQKIFS